MHAGWARGWAELLEFLALLRRKNGPNFRVHPLLNAAHLFKAVVHDSLKLRPMIGDDSLRLPCLLRRQRQVVAKRKYGRRQGLPWLQPAIKPSARHGASNEGPEHDKA